MADTGHSATTQGPRCSAPQSLVPLPVSYSEGQSSPTVTLEMVRFPLALQEYP